MVDYSNIPRDSRRVPIAAKVQFKFDRFSGFISEYSSNISPTGMYIVTDQPEPAVVVQHPEQVPDQRRRPAGERRLQGRGLGLPADRRAGQELLDPGARREHVPDEGGEFVPDRVHLPGVLGRGHQGLGVHPGEPVPRDDAVVPGVGGVFDLGRHRVWSSRSPPAAGARS